MSYIEEHEVLNSLTALQIWQRSLLSKVSHDVLPAWVALPSGEYRDAKARELACQVMSQMEYLPGQDGRETLVCPGVIVANPPILAMIHDLNARKDVFQEKCKALKEATQDRDAVRKLLNSNGMMHLNINHLYRHIPVVDVCPKKVSFTWASTRSLTRISRDEAVRRLLERGEHDSGILRQIDAAKSLPKDEPLVIIQHLKPQTKANITWYRTDEGLTRRLMNCPTPLFVPNDAKKGLPNCLPPRETQQRKQRKDVRIETFAFLPAIRCYRYLPEYRYYPKKAF